MSFLSPTSPLSALLKLVLFGLSNQMVVTFKDENTEAFRHLFLKDYQDDPDSPLAVHTQSDVYSQINYAIDQVGFPS